MSRRRQSAAVRRNNFLCAKVAILGTVLTACGSIGLWTVPSGHSDGVALAGLAVLAGFVALVLALFCWAE